MSRADRVTPPADVPFLPAGAGLPSTFTCMRCQQPRSLLGRRMRSYRGGRFMLCAGCIADLDAPRSAA